MDAEIFFDLLESSQDTVEGLTAFIEKRPQIHGEVISKED